MKQIILVFTDAAHADQVLAALQLLARDDVGLVQAPTGNTVTVEGQQVPEMAPVPGWHVVAVVDDGPLAPELVPHRVVPDYPVRRFAGIEDWAPSPAPTPGSLPPLAERQAAAWERIKAERDRRAQLGGYQVAGKWFHSDTFSRTQQIGLVMLGANLPAGLQWKTMDGSFVTMTPALAQQVFAAAAAADMAVFSAAEAHRAAMLQSASPETYSIAGGWPPVYQGA